MQRDFECFECALPLMIPALPLNSIKRPHNFLAKIDALQGDAMAFQQLRSGDGQHLVFLGAALIAVGRALQDSHGALFASQFVEEYGSEIERAAQRVRARRSAGTGGFSCTL